MNKRARNRLIGVTAIVVIVVAAFLLAASGNASYYKKVSEVIKDPKMVDQRVTVGGQVIPDSWDKKNSPMTFRIREANLDSGEAVENGPVVKVVYTGSAPGTFGNNVGVIVTGKYQQGGVINADTMITKCPSKYQSSTDAKKVGAVVGASKKPVGVFMKVSGTLVAGSLKPVSEKVRFVLEDSGKQLPVSFKGGTPTEMKDGSKVVVSGQLGKDDVFVATEVALGK